VCSCTCNRPFPHSISVRTNNSTRARLGWTFLYICCILVYPDLDSAPLIVGIRERSVSVEIRGRVDVKGTIANAMLRYVILI